jgi:hypothetical protein
MDVLRQRYESMHLKRDWFNVSNAVLDVDIRKFVADNGCMLTVESKARTTKVRVAK